MYIGGRSYCVDCGDERLRYDSDDCSELQCSDCTNDGYECYYCGSVEDEDRMHEIDGDYYCEDCCFYCDIHNEWEIRYEGGHDCMNEVCIDGSYYTICDDGLEEEVFYCEECDEPEWRSEACYIEELGQTVCRECYENFMNRKENENEVA